MMPCVGTLMMASSTFPCTSAVDVEVGGEVGVEVGVEVDFVVGPGIPVVGIIIIVIVVVGIMTIIGLESDALFRSLSATGCLGPSAVGLEC